MQPFRRHSLVEQTAAHLREGFRSGRWGDRLPGAIRLSGELGVSKQTVRDALHQLEAEGLLKDCGAGRSREIVGSAIVEKGHKRLRVGVLLSEPLEGDNAQAQHLFLSMKQSIESAGHVCFFGAKAMNQLGQKVDGVARLVKAAKADAWIVSSGTREILEWFVAQQIPVCAIGGRVKGLPIASSRIEASGILAESVRRCAGYGHRRIVLICPSFWRHPRLESAANAFLAELESYGIAAGDYNLPEWEESAEGLQRILESLFQFTPPTALILTEPLHCVATLAFLARRNLQVPADVSLICLATDPVFAWQRPVLAHVVVPFQEHIQRVARWVDATACGTIDREQKNCVPTFEPGGSIAPVRKINEIRHRTGFPVEQENR